MNYPKIYLDTIFTKDPHSGIGNGRLIPMLKDETRTSVYMTIIAPRSFKGYHLHKIRTNRLICVKGCIEVKLWVPGEKHQTIRTMFTDPSALLLIPTNVATGLKNNTDEEAWVLSFPDPPYDPVVNEQVDYSYKELMAGVIKE